MGTLTKCVLVPLVYLDTPEIPYKDFCAAFWEIQKQTRSIKNKISTDFFVQKNMDMRIHEETGEWPKFSKLDFTNRSYHTYKDEMPMYQTGNLTQMVKSEVDALVAHWKDVLCGKRTIDNFRGDQPVVIKGQNLKLAYDGTTCIISIGLFSNMARDRFQTKNGVVRFEAKLRDKSLRAIASRCATGEYKANASQLKYNREKRKFELLLSYTFEHEAVTELDPEKVLGVDLGIRNAYYTATNYDAERFFEPGGDIEAFRLKVEAERWKRKKQRAVCGDGSIGHGYKKRMAPVLAVSDKIARYRAHKNHLMARKIVDEAVRLGCGVIQVEDLSGIQEDKKFLKNWPYYDLQQKIISKASELGIEVRKVDPAYTTLRCCKCGTIDEDNCTGATRYAVFECVSCGYKTDADYNAAKNLSNVDIARIIKETMGDKKTSNKKGA